jgi:hypothetical protein
VTGRFGPQTEQLERLPGVVRGMTPRQIADTFADGRYPIRDTERDTARSSARCAGWAAGRDMWADVWAAELYPMRDALTDAMRYAAQETGLDPARHLVWDAMWAALWDAVLALLVWDLAGQHGLTQDHLETLIGPAEDVLGPLRPQGRTA